MNRSLRSSGILLTLLVCGVGIDAPASENTEPAGGKRGAPAAFSVASIPILHWTPPCSLEVLDRIELVSSAPEEEILHQMRIGAAERGGEAIVAYQKSLALSLKGLFARLRDRGKGGGQSGGGTRMKYAGSIVRYRDPDCQIQWSSHDEADSLGLSDGEERPRVLFALAQWSVVSRDIAEKTLAAPDLRAEMQRFRAVLLDLTDKDEISERVMKRNDIMGVPTVVLFGSDGLEKSRLVGTVDPDSLLTLMRSIR